MVNVVRNRFRPMSRSVSSMAETDQDRAFRHVAEAVQRVNDAVIRAVNTGMTVEIVRSSRHHDGQGHWGDQMKPAVPESKWKSTSFTAAEGAAMVTETGKY